MCSHSPFGFGVLFFLLWALMVVCCNFLQLIKKNWTFQTKQGMCENALSQCKKDLLQPNQSDDCFCWVLIKPWWVGTIVVVVGQGPILACTWLSLESIDRFRWDKLMNWQLSALLSLLLKFSKVNLARPASLFKQTTKNNPARSTKRHGISLQN